MKKNLKSILIVSLFGGFIVVFLILSLAKGTADYSYTERRALKKWPSFELEDLRSGAFMSDFETASLDQFALRDTFRAVKSNVSTYVFLQLSNHGFYKKDGALAKLEYPENEDRMEKNAAVLNEVYEMYLKDTDCKVYLSLISDKNRFLTENSLYPHMDYEKVQGKIAERLPFAAQIEINDLLSKESFYRTDQHWAQEKIVPVAERLLSGMGRPASADYTEHTLEQPFYGTYASQAAVLVQPDSLTYLTNAAIDGAAVTGFGTGTGKNAPVYNMKKAEGRDPYEMFLSGSEPLLVIENAQADTEAELVIFRDSFGSSLVPLLIPSYRKITVVDLRYISRELLADYVDFKDQDVLFLYSTLIFNNSISK